MFKHSTDNDSLDHEWQAVEHELPKRYGMSHLLRHADADDIGRSTDGRSVSAFLVKHRFRDRSIKKSRQLILNLMAARPISFFLQRMFSEPSIKIRFFKYDI